MANTRALLLALALESSSGSGRGYVRFGRRKHGYVATLLVRPEEYRLFGFLDGDDGMELLWQYTGQPRLVRS